VREDVTQIVLNLKKLNIRFDGEEPKRVRLEAHGPRVVTAAMFETSSSVDFTTPDQVICTLVGDDSQVSLEVVVESGKGYSPAGQRDRSNVPLGTVLVDALFNPVRNVAFSVSNTRVGQATNYDNLTLNVKTNGSLSPEDAVGAASKILQEQLKRFVNFQEDVEKATVERAAEAKLPFNRSLLKKVNELDLSLRASNCLARENIIYIGDLVTRSEADLLKTPNFGRKSLNEINELLKPMGLYLGMEVKEWPPEDIDGLMKSLDETFPATRG
jgi:DNA-directed RNA polymerase subunit alpha